MEGEGEKVEIKRTCVDRMLCNCFEVFSSMAEWESDGDSLGFSGCVTAASSSVTVVLVAPVSPSSVSGFGETVLSSSDCQFVESQTLHSPKSVTRLQHPGKRFAGSKTEVNIGTARDRTVIKKMKQSLDRCESLEMELGVDNRFFALNARGEQQQRLFHTFSQQGTSDFLVASVARWDEHERILVIHDKGAKSLTKLSII